MSFLYTHFDFEISFLEKLPIYKIEIEIFRKSSGL
jgi:hypothetical protein